MNADSRVSILRRAIHATAQAAVLAVALSLLSWQTVYAQSSFGPTTAPQTAGDTMAAGPTEVMGRLMVEIPRPRWLPDGCLLYHQAGGSQGAAWWVFDPATGTDSAAAAGLRAGALPAGAVPGGPDADTAWARLRVVRPGMFGYSAPVLEVPAPDGRWLAGEHGGNLWVRSATTRDSVRLTAGATADDGYDVLGARWSPDSRRLAVRRVDARRVPTVPLVRWGAPGQPVVRHPYSRVGQPVPVAGLDIVGRADGATIHVAVGDAAMPYIHIVGWSPDGRWLYFMRTSRLTKHVQLVRADASTGRSRVLLSETAKTFIGGLPFLDGNAEELDALHWVSVLRDGRFVWTSDRSGWRRLYLYAADGSLVRPLTPAGSAVVRVVAVDRHGGWVYYVARPDHRHPYDEALLRVRLAGGRPRLVSAGPQIQNARLGPHARFVWIMRSDTRHAPVLDVRRVDGRLRRRIQWGADVLARYGRRPPVPFAAKAADDSTMLDGLLFLPRNFSPSRSYPVLDQIYAGPQSTAVPRSVRLGEFWMAQGLAERGFVVVTVDARGTPGRSKAFQDAFYGRIGQHEIADHAAVIRGLAATRPYMDTTRVGVVGHSWGGYFALRALLQAPALFRVGVASAADADLADFRVSIEPYMGCVPATCPDAYARGSNTTLAGRLRGKLLLLHGTADEDVPFGESITMIRALEKAGRSYDFAVFPGAIHTIFVEPYWWHRVTRFLEAQLRP